MRDDGTLSQGHGSGLSLEGRQSGQRRSTVGSCTSKRATPPPGSVIVTGPLTSPSHSPPDEGMSATS